MFCYEKRDPQNLTRHEPTGSNTRCYTVGLMKRHSKDSKGEANAKPEVIKLGLDLHAKQVTECRQLDGATAKPAQQWSPWKLLTQVENWVKEGIKVYSCYEAGACGYWYHR